MAVAAVLVTSILWGTTGTAATFVPTAGPLAIAAASLGVGGLLAVVVVGRHRVGHPVLEWASSGDPLE